ncbi:MAG: glycosyltransferase family 1 protein [Chitinophagia bacterium]|jgi:glycosyltransferase involved in cell wall biosynthesis
MHKKYILGIDAMNIRDGGGLTHLREILTYATNDTIQFDRVIVWGNTYCLEQLPNKAWLSKVNPIPNSASGLRTIFWQIFSLGRAARINKCDLVFIAGGSAFTNFKPFATICHNMLPFSKVALGLYPFGLRKCKFYILRLIQIHTFQSAKGVIFLSNWARDIIIPLMSKPNSKYIVIPHGINNYFTFPNRIHRNISDCSKILPFTLLYVSRIESYKNQLQVIDAFYKLCIETNWPLKLQLIGMASDVQYDKLVKNKIEALNSSNILVEYLGSIPYNQVQNYYHKADLGIFGSSCENMPIILLEKMAAGLPIICNDIEPMQDFLLDAGVYVNFDNVSSLGAEMKNLIEDIKKRKFLSSLAVNRSSQYNWEKCSLDTFQYLFELKNMHA